MAGNFGRLCVGCESLSVDEVARRDGCGSAGLIMGVDAMENRARWAMVTLSGLAASAALVLVGTFHPSVTAAVGDPVMEFRAHDLAVNVVSATFTAPLRPDVRKTDDTATARVDPSTCLARYSDVATNTGGTLGDYLKTIENMSPALKATSGDFVRQAAALDAAHTAMARAATRADLPGAEAQGRSAIQEANAAINAQGKTDEYTNNLVKTGAFERQWGRRSDQQLAVSPGTGAGSHSVLPASAPSGGCATYGGVPFLPEHGSSKWL